MNLHRNFRERSLHIINDHIKFVLLSLAIYFCVALTLIFKIFTHEKQPSGEIATKHSEHANGYNYSADRHAYYYRSSGISVQIGD